MKKSKVKYMIYIEKLCLLIKTYIINTMLDDFIEMINNIDFLYGFIYECTNLANNLSNNYNYNHLSIKLCSEFVMSIIILLKKNISKNIMNILKIL